MLGGAEVPKVLASDVATRRFKTGLQLGVLRANVELASQLAERAGLVLPLLDATSSAWSDAEARLGYGADHSAIIKWLESLTVETPETTGRPDRSVRVIIAIAPGADRSLDDHAIEGIKIEMTLRAVLRAHAGLVDIAGEFLAGFPDRRLLLLGLGAARRPARTGR